MIKFKKNGNILKLKQKQSVISKLQSLSKEKRSFPNIHIH